MYHDKLFKKEKKTILALLLIAHYIPDMFFYCQGEFHAQELEHFGAKAMLIDKSFKWKTIIQTWISDRFPLLLNEINSEDFRHIFQ